MPQPPRLFCRLSGRLVTGSGPARPLDIPCAWLRRNETGAWIVDSVPDADLCED